MTGNRYLYAGANPVGLIDDGHGPGCGGIRWSKLREHCTNQWMQHRNHREVHGLCGECPAAYRQFTEAFVNKYLPEMGLRHNYAADHLRAHAREGLGRWFPDKHQRGPNVVRVIVDQSRDAADRIREFFRTHRFERTKCFWQLFQAWRGTGWRGSGGLHCPHGPGQNRPWNVDRSPA